ncbi:MAG: hypothetical protein PHE58_05940, partial [Candidatus Omnitrophica bacterium]|nr:hypothetical protein [Candidatus Omnitrophota bacterium]
FLCFFSGNSNTFVLSLIVSGSLMGFLARNLPPAKIYMGNCGSHFLGFVLAVLAMMVHYAGLSNKIALLSPVLILWLPLWDTGLLIALRLSKKRIPFFKSRDHVYLRFLSLGYSRMKALKMMIALCAVFCLCGIFLAKVPFVFGGALIAAAGFLTAVVSIRISKVDIDG